MAKISSHDINEETTSSWISEIEIMQKILQPYGRRGSVYFEYSIPRMGRRVDVIALIDDIVFVVEFKTSEQKFTYNALVQVWDYAIDLKNFHLESHNRIIIPILIAPHEEDVNCTYALSPFQDKVYYPMQVNSNSLPLAIENVLNTVPHTSGFNIAEDLKWAKSGYEPTPTIIEAAIALYEENTVQDITRHDGDIDKTSTRIKDIIDICCKRHQKAICFVTGVPGAGKTLIGLQTAIDQFKKEGEKAVYLSGNYPLVEVLQEALTRDFIRKSKEDYRLGATTKKPCTKAKAKSEVKTFIQMVHHYRDFYLEGTEVRNGEIVPIEGYFTNQTDKDKAYVPTEHVAIFDEAQRAWTKEELSRFMKKKKHKDNFPYSEPQYLISCVDRHPDWGVIICLIGGGQEINKGEAGLKEWIEAINDRFPHWHVYMSGNLTDSEYANGNALASLTIPHQQIHKEDDLHLAVSMRSFRAEKVSLFIHQLLELNQQDARATLKQLNNYPIVLTRSLDKAKQWLKAHARGSNDMAF